MTEKITRLLVNDKKLDRGYLEKEDVDERQVLTIMGYFTYIKCKDSPQKVIDVYIGLWNSILEKIKRFIFQWIQCMYYEV